MKTRILDILVLLIISTYTSAQTTYLSENEEYLFWQPERKINFSDYQETTDSSCVKYNLKYGVQMVSFIEIKWVVDIPNQRKHKRDKQMDKAYIAPVFCKKCSCMISEDSLCLKVDRMLLDIAEISARFTRKELIDLQTEMKADNVNQMFFISVHNKWEQYRVDYSASILQQVLLARSDSTYIEWRKTTDELLEHSKEYATQPEDCYRFVLDEPIEKGYIMAKKIMGDWLKKEE